MADFPGNSRVSTDYQAKVTTLYCLEQGCAWKLAEDGTNVPEARLAKALREHHKTDHPQA